MQDSISNISTKFDDSMVKPISYRPFDNRLIYYDLTLLERPRLEIMRHVLEGNNLALVAHKREELQVPWSHAMVTEHIAEHGSLSSKTTNYIFLLYLYDQDAKGVIHKSENTKPAFRRWIDAHYGQKLSPKNIMHYMYAVLHSPDYRRRYADFLRIDFPVCRLSKTLRNLIAWLKLATN